MSGAISVAGSDHPARVNRRLGPGMATVLLLCSLLAACGGGGDSSWELNSNPEAGGLGEGGGDDGGQGSSTPPGDDDDTPPTGSFSLPVIVQEALPNGEPGVDRLGRVATFGVPIARNSFIELDPVSGRPLLAVAGATAYQISTLDTWPSGVARWALIDVYTDMAGGGQAALEVIDGPGASSQPDLASDHGSVIRIDTGPLQASMSTVAFDLFERVLVDGVLLVDTPATPSLFGTDAAGGPLTAQPGATVTIETNGPVRCVVRADGSLVDAADQHVLDYTVRITARRGSRDLEVTTTLRNAAFGKQEHVVLGSMGVSTDLRAGLDGATATFATPPGQDNHVAELEPGDTAFAYQSYSDAATKEVFSKDWLAPIDRTYPVNPGDPAAHFDETGYQLQVDGLDVLSLGDKSEFPRHGFVDLTGTLGGITLVYRQMPYFWPASLEVDGDGTVAAGLWSGHGPNDFTMLWQQHESRSVLFSFHTGASNSPNGKAQEFDFPLVGRAADFGHYQRAGVFAYELLTIEEHEQALQLMGIDHTPFMPNQSLELTRYLANSTTGGSNNFPSIETDLGGSWLRHGRGGAYLNGLDLALWKAEWQIRRSDDFADDGDDPIIPINNHDGPNPIPHTKKSFSDDEHRYREGIILAYHLTGDPRYRDAIFDEAEVLKGVDVWEHERSMYRTLVAMAHVIEFTGDTVLRDQYLVDRLEYITTTDGVASGGKIGIIDVCNDTSGSGWEGPPLDIGGITAGMRRYYTYGNDNNNEKPPNKFDKFGSNETEHFQTRGFITASFGPTGYYHAARVLDANNPDHAAMHFNARSRMRDLSWYTMRELYPFHADPADRRLVYSYPMCLQLYGWTEDSDFHPILVGMAETYLDYAGAGLDAQGEQFLAKGVEQLEAAFAHGDMNYFTARLDVMHFMAVYRNWALGL